MKNLKKLCAALLVCVFVLLCGCGEKETPKDETSKAQKTEITKTAIGDLTKLENCTVLKNENADSASRMKLSNTLYKLKSDKKLNIVYYGGSITHGVGASAIESTSYRALTTKWFKENYPDAEINGINAAVSGTGAYYGNARLERDVFPHNPDLIFIEYAINDGYQKNTADESGFFIESLITRLNKKFPNLDIVILITTDQAYYGDENAIMQTHRMIANHYGIACVNVAKPLQDKIGKGDVWKQYLSDWVHPADAGYTEYAEALTTELKALLSASTVSYTAHTMPEPYYKGLFTNAEIISFKAKDADAENGWRAVGTNEGKHLFSTKAGSEYNTKFSGSSIGAFVKFDTDNVPDVVHFIVDEKYVKTVSFKWNASQNQTLWLANNLENTEHTLRIVNESGKRCEIMNLFATK